MRRFRSRHLCPVAHLELEREDQSDGIADMIEVEIPTEQYRKLNLTEGETLVVRPKRMQVFLKDGTGAMSKPPQAASIAENI